MNINIQHNWQPSDRMKKLAAQRGALINVSPFSTIEDALNAFSKRLGQRLYLALMRACRGPGLIKKAHTRAPWNGCTDDLFIKDFSDFCQEIRKPGGGKIKEVYMIGRSHIAELQAVFSEYF